MAIEFKQGDTAEPLTATLKVGGEPIDLSVGATVAITVSRDGSIVVADAPCTIVSGVGGVVSYDLDLSSPGLLTIEFVVTFFNQKKRIVPTRGGFEILVNPRIRG